MNKTLRMFRFRLQSIGSKAATYQNLASKITISPHPVALHVCVCVCVCVCVLVCGCVGDFLSVFLTFGVHLDLISELCYELEF